VATITGNDDDARTRDDTWTGICEKCHDRARRKGSEGEQDPAKRSCERYVRWRKVEEENNRERERGERIDGRRGLMEDKKQSATAFSLEAKHGACNVSREHQSPS